MKRLSPAADTPLETTEKSLALIPNSLIFLIASNVTTVNYKDAEAVLDP